MVSTAVDHVCVPPLAFHLYGAYICMYFDITDSKTSSVSKKSRSQWVGEISYNCEGLMMGISWGESAAKNGGRQHGNNPQLRVGVLGSCPTCY